MQLTNQYSLPISIAVWLSTDGYDHNHDPFIISATTFNKPIRSIVLARQNKDLDKSGDISSMIPARIGTAIHESIENSWNNGSLYESLESLGYPKKIIDRIEVNPDPNNIPKDCIPVFMEVRGHKKLGEYTISGKFDFVIEGALEDFKSTGTYSYINGTNTDDYIRQGSIYRWLHQNIVTQNHMNIRFIFTDWSAAQSKSDKSYPQSRIVSKSYDLMSIPETEVMLKRKLNEISTLMPLAQKDLPECTPQELWQKPDIFKYYKNPAKRARSTKNFNTEGEAYQRLAQDGNVGVVVKVPGVVMRCKYCDVNEICHQAKLLVEHNLLTL